MSQYRRLYLIAEPSPQSAAAVQRATALAQASGAMLHILTFFEPTTSMRRLDQVDQALLRESALQECRHWVEQLAEQVRAKGIQVYAEAICSDDPLEEILIQVAEQKPDLVIKGAQSDSELLRAFVTPLDYHLLRECPVPVHLVDAAIHPLPRKIIAAVDVVNTEQQVPGLNQRIIQAANGLALQCNADLHLLYVCDLGSAHLADALSVAWDTDFVEDQREALWSAFTAMADRYSVPIERRHFVVGRTIGTIAEFAVQSRADVIVMGRMQRHGLERIIGSTTEHVLHRVPCSILAVEPG